MDHIILIKSKHSFKSLVAKLANKLQRQLLAKQNRSWEFDLEEGLLDSSKLPRVIMDPYNSLSFKKENRYENLMTLHIGWRTAQHNSKHCCDMLELLLLLEKLERTNQLSFIIDDVVIFSSSRF